MKRSLLTQPAPLPMSTRRSIPTRTGSQMESSYILGHNPRKQAFTSEEGVRGIPAMGVKRKRGGLSQHDAPHKTDMQHFDQKFNVTFGNTGMDGES